MLGLNRTKGIATIVAVLLTGVSSVTQAQDLILPQNDADPLVLHVGQGVPQAEVLKVFVAGGETPIAGQYVSEGEDLSFVPAFGFEPGQDYVAQIIADGEVQDVAFRLPETAKNIAAAVTAIYPSGDVLPENTLRFYIHFSTPMRPQVAFDYIRLIDDTGATDEAAFMRFKQELWSEDRTRLTVLSDPGRIKREVVTNVELGTALLAGRRYALVVDEGWPSADGTSRLPGFTKTFEVSDALRTLPNLGHWDVSKPCVGTSAPLVVTFDRPFDRHQLPNALRVVSGAGVTIEGGFDIKPSEYEVRFTPVDPWPTEDLLLVVDPTLEDVAGNNFQDLLDQVAVPQINYELPTHRLIFMSRCSD